jgi:hypothetical protein
MPGRTSRWKAQHVGCQAAVDALRRDLTAEIERLTNILAQIHAIAVENPQGNDARESIETIEGLSRRA